MWLYGTVTVTREAQNINSSQIMVYVACTDRPLMLRIILPKKTPASAVCLATREVTSLAERALEDYNPG
jgi:hypothetical protein